MPLSLGLTQLLVYGECSIRLWQLDTGLPVHQDLLKPHVLLSWVACGVYATQQLNLRHDTDEPQRYSTLYDSILLFHYISGITLAHLLHYHA